MIAANAKARVKIHRHQSGQTVTFGPYEWLYSSKGLTKDTRRQIEELSAQGEAIQVFEWPTGKVIFQEGQWKA